MKVTTVTFFISSIVSYFPLELVFSDVLRPVKNSSSGFQNYVSFIDDYRKFIWIYLLKKKEWHVWYVSWFPSTCWTSSLSQNPMCSVQLGCEYEKLSNAFFRQLGIEHHVSRPALYSCSHISLSLLVFILFHCIIHASLFFSLSSCVFEKLWENPKKLVLACS